MYYDLSRLYRPTNPSFHRVLGKEQHQFISVFANCTDKWQPLNLFVNKPLKDEMKQHFQSWYAEEVRKQLESGVAIQEVKIDTRTSALKPKRANWLMESLESLSQKPEIVLH